MKNWRVYAIGLPAIMVLGAGGALWSVSGHMDAPLEETPFTFTVEPGSHLRGVLKSLHKNGHLAHPQLTYWHARLTGNTGIRKGEYEAQEGDTPRTLLQKMREGRVKLHTITIAEGLNRWDVRRLLEQTGWMSGKEFDALCDDKKFLETHSIPGPTCEGYVYPETYSLPKGIAPKELFAAFFEQYKHHLARATASGRGPLNLEEREFVTLASIVEKETGAPQERPRIACLFYNRLIANQKGYRPPWKLQTDPTVIYAATLADPNFDGNIRYSHLRAAHPYNTYHIVGLPPGPIANPGKAALEAVAKPSQCKDFFFVSKNNGEHVFCDTLACHEKAVQKWQVEYFNKKKKKSAKR